MNLDSVIAHLYLLHAMSWLLIPILGYRFSAMTYGETLIGLPAGFGLSYFASCLLAAAAVALTTLSARHYLPWKQRNKQSLIAKYIE